MFVCFLTPLYYIFPSNIEGFQRFPFWLVDGFSTSSFGPITIYMCLRFCSCAEGCLACIGSFCYSPLPYVGMKCVDRYTNLRAVQQVFSEAQQPNVRIMTSFVQVCKHHQTKPVPFSCVLYRARAPKSWNKDTSPRRTLRCTSRARPSP